MKALVGAYNQEKALVGAFSVIVQPVVEPMEHYTALEVASSPAPKRRGSISPFLVGPGTPPPIILPGSLALDLGLGGEEPDRERANSSAHSKQEQTGKKNTKKR